MAGTGRESTKGFWQTLPGILTGIATVIGAIGSLAVALYQIYKPADQSPKAPSDQSSKAPSQNFEVIRTQDGFVSVRAAPSTTSPEKARLYAGTRIACQDIVKGERLWESSDWRYCPTVDGFIHSKLLIQPRQ